MSFIDDESSEQNGSARDLYAITLGVTTYYLTSATKDISYGGHRYVATAMGRGDTSASQLETHGDRDLLEIALPADHAIIRRWFASGIPPTSTSVTAYRLQTNSGEAEQQHTGPIVSVRTEGNTVKLYAGSLLGEPMRKRLPVLTAGAQCGHVLYDDSCLVSRSGSDPDSTPFKCSTTPLQVAGRDIRLNLSNVPADHARRSTWLMFGELVVTSGAASGERRTIRTQTDANPGISTVTTVSLSLLIPNLKIGDSIDVYAGCQHDISDCSERFANIARYGGFPWMRAEDNSWRARLTGQKKT